MESPGFRETLTAERLQLRMDALGAIQSLNAQGSPSIQLDRTPQIVSINAETELSFSFEQGTLTRMETWGKSTLKETTQDGTLQIDASSLDMVFLDGALQRCTARGPVETLRTSETGGQKTRCEYLEVDYDSSGQIKRIIQTGDVEISQIGEVDGFTMTAEKAVLENEDLLLVLSGKPSLKRSTGAGKFISKTNASSISMSIKDYRIEASGPVLSIFALEKTLVSIAADNMRTGEGTPWIIYTGRPRLLYGENKIESDHLKIDPELQSLVAAGAVVSRFVMTKGRGLSQISANSLEIDSVNGKAIFSGDVVATAEGWIMRAPTIELYFKGSNLGLLNRVHSTGGVEIEAGNRSANGDTAVYFPEEGKVVVYGQDAQIIDPERGKAIGRKLTFYLSDDRLLIEGQ